MQVLGLVRYPSPSSPGPTVLDGSSRAPAAWTWGCPRDGEGAAAPQLWPRLPPAGLSPIALLAGGYRGARAAQGHPPTRILTWLRSTAACWTWVMCSSEDDFLSLLPLTHPTVASHRFIYCLPRHRNSSVEPPLPRARPLLGQPEPRSAGGGRAFPWAAPQTGGLPFPGAPTSPPHAALRTLLCYGELTCMHIQRTALQMALGIPGCARSLVCYMLPAQAGDSPLGHVLSCSGVRRGTLGCWRDPPAEPRGLRESRGGGTVSQ